MNNKANIELWINGIRVYTRKVMPHKKYTHALINRDNPTRILACSSTGKFEPALLHAGRVLPVQWCVDDSRVAHVWITLSEAECDLAIDYCERMIEAARKVDNFGAMADYQGDIDTMRKVRTEAAFMVAVPEGLDPIEVEDPIVLKGGHGTVRDSEGKNVVKVKKAKKAKVSTETEEKMMQRFLGQCREMLRKAGADKVEWLMQRAAADLKNESNA
jgi:hypothetical protein